MGSVQSRDCDLPIINAVGNGGSDTPPSTPALHLVTNVLFPSLGPLATLAICFLTNKPVHDATLASLLELFALSILCLFGALLATSLVRSTTTALAALLHAAMVLSAASAIASLVSALLQPRFRLPAYYSYMAYTLALLVMRGGDRTNTLRRNLGVSGALDWVSCRVGFIKEWFRTGTGNGVAPAST